MKTKLTLLFFRIVYKWKNKKANSKKVEQDYMQYVQNDILPDYITDFMQKNGGK